MSAGFDHKHTIIMKGGRRDGCGRHPMPEGRKRVQTTISIDPVTKARMEDLKARGVKMGREIDSLVERLYLDIDK